MQNDKCPEGEKAQKKFYKNKGLMATWDDSESEEDSKEEQATIALMGITKIEPEAELSSEDELDSDEDELYPILKKHDCYNQEEEDSEDDSNVDFAHITSTEDDSAVDLTPEAESDSSKEDK